MVRRPFDAAARRAGIERLESRTLFAGDVHVFLDDGGNLIVVGDGAANGIRVDTAGDFSIAGVDAGGGPTRVNGEPNGDVRFPVTGEGDVRLFLHGGDDVVEVGFRADSVDAPDDLGIYTGDGNDSITTLGDTNVADDLEIATGPGDDVVRVLTTDVGDDLDILTDSGDDSVNLYGTSVGDDLLVRTGGGRDAVGVGFTEYTGTGGGRITAPVVVADDTLIDLGADDDTLGVIESIFRSAFFADGGAGADVLERSGNAFGGRRVFIRFERSIN